MKGGRQAALGGSALLAGLAFYSARVARDAEKQVPQDGALLDVAGTHLHVVDRGQGTPILMIHGLGGQLRNFNYGLVDELAADHRVIIVDRPGAGYSPALTGPDAGIEAQGRLMAALVERLELDRPLLVGHSLGGAVSLAVAVARPELTRGLALIAPLTQPPSAIPRLLSPVSRLPYLARLALAGTMATPLGRLSHRRTLETVFAPEPVAPDFATRGGGALSRRPQALAAAISDVGGIESEMRALAERYPRMSMPTAILFGRGDRILDPALNGSQTVAQIPGARLELVEGGHMLPVTQPGLVARFITEALQRSSSG